MNKIITTLVIITILIVSCAKKMTPASGNTSTQNTGSVQPANAPIAEQQPTTKITALPATTVATNATAQAAKQTRGGTLTLEQKGQSIYNVKCSQCHGLKVTTDYTWERWATVMQLMAVRANLSEEEKENVLAYVKANAKK